MLDVIITAGIFSLLAAFALAALTFICAMLSDLNHHRLTHWLNLAEFFKVLDIAAILMFIICAVMLFVYLAQYAK